MTRTWTIGSSPDCDLVVDLPTVSGRHCRLTSDDQGFFLEDLGSTNGTYVNGRRWTGRDRVSRGDAITLGLKLAMPWPDGPARQAETTVIRIGREPDNDYVVDVPTVSGHHARVVRDGASGQAYLEDLGSANGTALGDPERKITRSPLSAADTIYLGSTAVPAARVLAQFEPVLVPIPVLAAESGEQADWGLTAVVADESSESRPAPFATNLAAPTLAMSELRPLFWWSSLPEEFLRTLNQPWRLPALFVQAPLLAVVLVAVLGSKADDPRSAAPALFWLGLAAVWFGLSDAVIGSAFGTKRPLAGRWPEGAVRLVPRFVVLGALCVFQCVLCWAIVSNGVGLKGPMLPAVALLVMAAGAGLSLGLTAVALAPHPAVALAFLPLAILPQWLLGGEFRPLSRMPAVARSVANALPSRWAFEGLLLAESERRRAPATTNSPSDSEGADQATIHDLAEPSFPAATTRMGYRADALALGAMLFGWSALVAFLATGARPARFKEYDRE